MSGRGAWPYVYEKGLDFRGDPQGRGAHGIYALKNELLYNGFTGNINDTLAYWGDAAVEQTRKAQAHFGLATDGILGPTTARALFRYRCSWWEQHYNLPQHLLARIKTLESSDDPVAQGFVDPNDEGLWQENLPSNPTLTQVQCWTPSFISQYAAQQLRGHINACGAVKAGTAAWNIGNFYALQWKNAGYPASGGPEVDGNDIYIVATQYVTLVNSEPL